jgi:hypothetical protein
MWLTASSPIQEILAEGPLEPLSDNDLNRVVRAGKSEEKPLTPDEVNRLMPVVEIWLPQTRTLRDWCKPAEIPHFLQDQARKADFYLVDLACSFSTKSEEGWIDWARFTVELNPDEQLPIHQRPCTIDLYPMEITQRVEKAINVTLNPQFKFHTVEVGIGKVEFGIKHEEQIPEVSGLIGTGFKSMWNYDSLKGRHRIQGTKWMYLLVKAPKGFPRANVRLKLEADVIVGNTRVSAIFRHRRKQEAVPLTANLWPLP